MRSCWLGRTTDFALPAIDENDGAAMCFTSGTTGFSKGVIYSHRALVLHSLAECAVDAFGVSHQDTVLPSRRCFTPTPGACRTPA